ncbi:MAG: DUF2730 domain-containing protein [Bacteroidaceae bacterium]|nr:DUF2730 domain-containing protein [Bacteroidaceae bacterium]
MKKFLLLLMAGMLLADCSMREKRPPFSLKGVWVMKQVVVPQGYVYEYPADEGTWMRLYEGDSMMYEFRLTLTEQALVVKPESKCGVTLIDKGHDEHLYLEEEDPRPLIVMNDTTITIQRMGRVSTWQRAENIEREWGTEIRAIIERDLVNGATSDDMHNYVLSAKEREQADIIHKLIYAIIGVFALVIIIAQIALANRKAKRRLQLQLQQIHEEHDERPQPVRQAIESVESTYFSSDEYHTLQKRLSTGIRLKDEEWSEMETQLKKIYPGFTSQLRNLYPMSELEYQTCLLIKLRIVPRDIAAVMSRDMSTISTVRSRLYQKVFGKKGGSKEWDDFVLSIGA